MESITLVKGEHSLEDLSEWIVDREDRCSMNSVAQGFDILSMLAKVGITFFRYLRYMGMSAEPNVVVLSSKDQYNCSENDLKNARILINLRKLNLIKHLDVFLKALGHILPPDTKFIGYFSDEGATGGLIFRLRQFFMALGRRFNFPLCGFFHRMDRNEVADLLERNGFITVDMKDMNGFTYFLSMSISRSLKS